MGQRATKVNKNEHAEMRKARIDQLKTSISTSNAIVSQDKSSVLALRSKEGKNLVDACLSRDAKPFIKAELVGILAMTTGMSLEDAFKTSSALTVEDLNSAIRISIVEKITGAHRTSTNGSVIALADTPYLTSYLPPIIPSKSSVGTLATALALPKVSEELVIT